jgi:hypothetical protein
LSFMPVSIGVYLLLAKPKLEVSELSDCLFVFTVATVHS